MVAIGFCSASSRWSQNTGCIICPQHIQRGCAHRARSAGPSRVSPEDGIPHERQKFIPTSALFALIKIEPDETGSLAKAPNILITEELRVDTPPELTRLGSCFLQDDYKWGKDNFPAWASQAIALTHLPPDKIQSLKKYIDEILSNPDNDFVDRAWHSMGAALGVRGGGRSRELFKTIRELLDSVEVKS